MTNDRGKIEKVIRLFDDWALQMETSSRCGKNILGTEAFAKYNRDVAAALKSLL